MNNLASEIAIDKLIFECHVPQEQIDMRISARYAQILEAHPFFKTWKTRLGLYHIVSKYLKTLNNRKAVKTWCHHEQILQSV